MITNSINPDSTTPSIRLAGPEESLIQITFKLKNVLLHVTLRTTYKPFKLKHFHSEPGWFHRNKNPVKLSRAERLTHRNIATRYALPYCDLSHRPKPRPGARIGL